MDKSLDQIRRCGQVEGGLVHQAPAGNSESGDEPADPAAAGLLLNTRVASEAEEAVVAHGWRRGLIADADPDLDRADH